MSKHIRKGTGSVCVHGVGKLVDGMSIRIDFWEGNTHHLHLWRPDPRSPGGTVGTSFNHPQAIRAYAIQLLDMADRFETAVRPEWEARGGKWLSDDEIAISSNGGTKDSVPTSTIKKGIDHA